MPKKKKKKGTTKSPQQLGVMKSLPEGFHQSESSPGNKASSRKGAEDGGQCLHYRCGQWVSLLTDTKLTEWH